MKTSEPAPGLSRRDFVRGALGAAAAWAVAPAGAAQPKAKGNPAGAAGLKHDIGLLEKWFFDGGDGGALKYTPEQMAQTLDEIGLDLELTLRKNGHITPEKAPDELPPMAAALAKRNRRILWVALDTVRPDEPHWEKALRTAKQLGVPQYRHRGFQYKRGSPLKAQIADFNRMAKEFAAANREIGIQAVYQLHAGPTHAGSAAWDLDLILDGVDPAHFGVAMDTRHVMVEQGLAWPTAMELLAPRTVALCVKSFRWDGDDPVNVPLGQGRVNQAVVAKALAGRPLPICIHNEYFKGTAGKLAPVPFAQRAKIVEAFRADARVLRQWLGMA